MHLLNALFYVIFSIICFLNTYISLIKSRHISGKITIIQITKILHFLIYIRSWLTFGRKSSLDLHSKYVNVLQLSVPRNFKFCIYQLFRLCNASILYSEKLAVIFFYTCRPRYIYKMELYFTSSLLIRFNIENYKMYFFIKTVQKLVINFFFILTEYELEFISYLIKF